MLTLGSRVFHPLLAVGLFVISSCGLVGEAPTEASESTERHALVDFTQGIKLTPVFGGANQQFSQPVALFQSPDNLRYYVLEKEGRIVSVPSAKLKSLTPVMPTEVLNLIGTTPGKVNATGEGGMLGMAFHPNFGINGYVYVSYTAYTGKSGFDMESRISRFKSNDGGQTLNPASELVVLRLQQPYANHNGGTIAFGADGFLYASFGDGGAGGDPHGYGQDKTVLFGKIIRIDVNHGNLYAIPTGNPFAQGDGGARPEIWAYGLRNPWKWSFDGQTLWAADVGQATFEEINKITKGGNYGWNTCEGNHLFDKLSLPCDAPGMKLPVVEYAHTCGNASVTGGYVYRGNAIPGLVGAYIFGDFMSGNIFAFDAAAVKPTKRLMLQSGFNISSFGKNNTGELFVIDFGGGRILQIEKGDTASLGGDDDVTYNFLSRDGVGCIDEAIGYYNTIAPASLPFLPASTPPLSQTAISPSRKFTRGGAGNPRPTTLYEWTQDNIGSLSDTSKVVSAFYRNTSDLGFWREMVCSKIIRRGVGGCRVRNWENEGDRDAGVPNLGTVAMNISAAGATQFFAFDPSGRLTPVAKLDSEGFKAVPRLCTPCHGGNYKAGGDGDTGAIFREFEPSLLQARANITAEQAQSEWFALNQAIKGANWALATEADGAPAGLNHARRKTNDYINSMYPTGLPPALDVSADAHIPASYTAGITPALVAAKKTLYKQVVGPYCMQCHRHNSLDLSDYENFKTVGTGSPAMILKFLNQDPLAPTGISFMPQSEFMFARLKNDLFAMQAINTWLAQPER